MNNLLIVTKEFHKENDSTKLESIKNQIRGFIPIVNTEWNNTDGEKGHANFETEKTDFETAKSLKSQLLLIKGISSVYIEPSEETGTFLH